MTKIEAVMFRDNLYKKLNRDVYSSIDMRLDDATKEFQDYNKAQNLAETSRDQYDYVFKHLKEICPEILRTSQINSEAIRRFSDKRKEAVAAYTAKKNLTQLKTFCNWLGLSGYTIGKIVWPSIKARATKKKTIITPEQAKIILNRCRSEKEKLAFLVSLCTGLRASDVDSVTPACLIDGCLNGEAGKTGKEFNAPVPKALAERLKGFDNLYLSYSRWTDHLLVNICTRHDLRRTCAQWIAEADNTDIASELLQHSDQRVTKEWYAFAVKKVLVERVFGEICRL